MIGAKVGIAGLFSVSCPSVFGDEYSLQPIEFIALTTATIKSPYTRYRGSSRTSSISKEHMVLIVTSSRLPSHRSVRVMKSPVDN
jgi:hypothetical protein